jgi:tRNA G26 N,N-dimethylase Trm1
MSINALDVIHFTYKLLEELSRR